MIVAVDGPVAAGKGTLARRLANRFGFAYLDTGMLYRAVAARILREGGNPADPETATAAAKALTDDDRAAPDLREQRVGEAASQVAAIQSVRDALLALQRGFAHEPPGGAPGAVLDGRDIGTVVCPDADVKLFVTASPEVRARRRHEELRARGVAIDYPAVLADVQRRDARDRERAVAPLRPARDAHLLDTTNLDIEGAFQRACAIVARSR